MSINRAREKPRRDAFMLTLLFKEMNITLNWSCEPLLKLETKALSNALITMHTWVTHVVKGRFISLILSTCMVRFSSPTLRVEFC